MPQTYLLRIEAVNLEQVLEDTPQLSVIRGGSLFARQAPRDVITKLEDGHGLSGPLKRLWNGLCRKTGLTTVPELVSSGASVGLYQFRVPRVFANRLVKTITQALNKNYPHLTFVVDVQPLLSSADDFVCAHEAVIARNRFRQMQQPTLVLPQTENHVLGPCDWDGFRPATETFVRNQRQVTVSASAKARFDHGCEQKRQFLEAETGITGIEYANDFEELSGDFSDRRLRGKLAVIYFDGNGFGARQSNCRDIDELKDFDKTLRSYRTQFLRDFIQAIRNDEPFLGRRASNQTAERSPERVLRLELLLWGGDEILLVVPAWKGLETLFRFYEASAKWTWKDEPLTHAGALIFCHHKTPIDRMTALARQLAGLIKEAPEGRTRNLFEYLVLESVDYPAEPIFHYWIDRYGACVDRRCPLAFVASGLLHCQELARLRDEEVLPRGKLYDAVHGLIVPRHDTKLLAEKLAALDHTLEEIAKQHREKLAQTHAALTALFPGQEVGWRWLHFMELWDYLAPSKKET